VIGAKDSTWALMANAKYAFDIGKVHPYAKAGVGYAARDITIDALPLAALALESRGFAYQLGTGVDFDVTDDMQLGVGYNYFNGPSFAIGLGPFGRVSDGGDNHSLLATFTVALD
jgi:opacity protein-like surface antigen